METLQQYQQFQDKVSALSELLRGYITTPSDPEMAHRAAEDIVLDYTETMNALLGLKDKDQWALHPDSAPTEAPGDEDEDLLHQLVLMAQESRERRTILVRDLTAAITNTWEHLVPKLMDDLFLDYADQTHSLAHWTFFMFASEDETPVETLTEVATDLPEFFGKDLLAVFLVLQFPDFGIQPEQMADHYSREYRELQVLRARLTAWLAGPQDPAVGEDLVRQAAEFGDRAEQARQRWYLQSISLEVLVDYQVARKAS